MNLAEELEIRRINAALPFHDPIARVLTIRGHEFALFTPHWLADRRLQKQLDKISRRTGGYDDDF